MRNRNRGGLAGLAALILVLGWSARAYSGALPGIIGAYAPDALWAMLVFLLLLLAAPRTPTRAAAMLALGLSYGIEISQLYQAPWINGLRAARAGGLLLGHGFLWSDLICYSLGVALGAAVDAAWTPRRTPRRAPKGLRKRP